MGKLTLLLKKKKAKGDESSTSDIQDTGSNISAIDLSTPLSLNIPSASLTGSSISQEAPSLSLSLMEDIMDQLSGTTPDTPQPMAKSDFNDFSHVFDLSHQPESGGANGITAKPQIGKLEQSSAFKDNVFLRSQLQKGPNTTSSRHINKPGSGATGAPDSNISATQAFLRSGLQAAKEAEEREATAKLREASKKANAQLPSDDEGSDASDSEISDDDDDDDEETKALKKHEKQLLFLQQQQQLLYHQHQPLQQLSGGAESGRTESPIGKKPRGGIINNPWPTKPEPINHEAVIDRMKDRHRAVLAGAAAAARDEYYEEYMDEFGIQQQQPNQMAYMQYGDPIIYGMDEYRIQQAQQAQVQAQQQMYYSQGMPTHPHSMSGAYSSGPIPYGYAQAPMAPGYNPSGIVNGLYNMRSHMANMSHSTMSASGSDMSNSEHHMSPRRTSRQQSTTSSSARASEDSWTEPYPISNMSAQKAMMNDSGYSGAHDQKSAFGEGQDDQSEVDDVTKVIDGLSISKRRQSTSGTEADNDDESHIGDGDGDGDAVGRTLFEDPESTRGSNLVNSMNGLKDVTSPNTVSSSPSGKASNDNDSSDDDQPIIMSRRGSGIRANGLPKLNTSFQNGEYSEDALVTPINQMPYLPHGKNMYSLQPIPMQSVAVPMQQTPTMAYPQQQIHHHQLSSIPHGYQFPAVQTPVNMGHHHSYSLDRIPPNMMVPGTPTSGPMGPMGHVGHMGQTGQMRQARHSYQQSRDLRQGMISPITVPGGHFGQPMQPAPAQTQYPIPPTTLLHPLPRRSQSVRAKGNPMTRNDSPSRQLNGPASVTRGRSSIEYARLPGGSIGVAGADFVGANGPYIRGFSDPLSSPGPLQPQLQQQMISAPNSMGHDKQAHQFQMSAQQLQQQQQRESPTQGYYMSPSYGYPMFPNDQYSHMHQQIVQPGRR